MSRSSNHILRLLFVLALLPGLSFTSRAQFKEEAFNQSYNDPADTTASRDSVDKMFSFKEFFRGVSHKDTTLRIGTMFGGSTVFIGAEQIYNRQYWKLPIVYGGLGTTVGMGFHYRNRYNDSKKAFDAAFALDPETTMTVDTRSKDMATAMFASAGFIYWATLMDGVVNYKKDVKNQPGKATIYSILMPGLGQCYNGEYWKVPIYWGGIIGSCHFYFTNRKNYLRYKRIHNEASSPDGGYTGLIPAERALYYRNVFRRYRDYSMVAIAGFYLLQVIDANVFAYMQDFDVSDDLTMQITPTVITPYNEYASASSFSGCNPCFGAPVSGVNAYGLRIGITF
jgi:hypothetical protein